MKKLLLSLGAIASVAAPVAAVVACGTTPAATYVDEGFTEGSLIENFDADLESQQEISGYEFNYAGKDYSNDYQAMINAWIKDLKVLITNGHHSPAVDFGPVHMPASTQTYFKLNGITDVSAKFDGEKVTITFVQDQKSIKVEADGSSNKVPVFVAETPADIEKVSQGIMDYLDANGPVIPGKLDKDGKPVKDTMSEYYIAMAGSDIEARPENVLSKLKHSVDSLIYSEAQSLKNTVKTDKDIAFVTSTKDEFQMSEIPEAGYTAVYAQGSTGSFTKGDSITFAFDRESDLKSFTQRVGYVDGNKHMFTKETMLSKAFGYAMIGGKFYSVDPVSKIIDESKSEFRLDVIARNAVKLTFLNSGVVGGAGTIDARVENQGSGKFLYLNGFKDINGDGKINSEDAAITPSFSFK